MLEPMIRICAETRSWSSSHAHWAAPRIVALGSLVGS
jgi:hypothetical protein